MHFYNILTLGQFSRKLSQIFLVSALARDVRMAGQTEICAHGLAAIKCAPLSGHKCANGRNADSVCSRHYFSSGVHSCVVSQVSSDANILHGAMKPAFCGDGFFQGTSWSPSP